MRKKVLSFALAFCMLLGMSAFLPEGVFTQSTSLSASADEAWKCIATGEHQWDLVKHEIATCDRDGYWSYKCKRCGKTKKEVDPRIAEHDFFDWEVEFEPTCTQVGKRTRKCRYCELVANEAIKPTGHKYDRDHVEIVQATCTVGGYRKYTCTVCGDKKIEYFSDPLGHDWGEWTVAKAATCEEDGVETQTCKRCGAVEKRNISKLYHRWSEWETVRQESCEVGAKMARHCEKCGKTEEEEFSPIGHYLTDWNTSKEPTCTEDGERERHCQRAGCSYQEKETIAAKGHFWGEYKIIKQVTCTEDGIVETVCERCGEKRIVTNKKFGHQWSDWKETKKATCSQEGEEERVCATCGEKETRKIDKLAHNWSAWRYSKLATCTEDGERYRTCSVCGRKETQKEEKLGHEHARNDKPTVVEPTCTAKGYTEYKCYRCGKKYKTDYKDALGHKWLEPVWTWSKDKKSATAKFVCDHDKKHTKILDAKISVEKTPATCEKNGVIEIVAMVKLDGRICSAVESQKIDKLGHSWGKPTWEWSKDLKKCKVKFTCTRDKSHTMSLTLTPYTETKKATCTGGTKVDTIVSVQVGGKVYSDKKTTIKNDALGHKWSAWKTTGFDLTKKTSVQTRKCTACGKTATRTNNNAITRLAGANRFDSAAVISKAMYKTSNTVVIATGLTHQDALVAVPLASAYNAPLLLATEKHITAQTEAELKRLKAKNVIVVSTNGAIGAKAKAEFKAAKYNMTYIEGKTCFETAAKVAKALQTKTKKAPDTIFFATDSAFADALSASPVAAIKNAPIMYLKNTGSIDKATADYLKSVKGKVKNAYIIGGSGVISDAMMKNVANALGLTVNKTVVRVAGKNRYETCTAFNNKFKSVLTGDGICVAKGLDFPDALAGGVYAASTKQALFLADGKKLQDCQNTYLKGKSAGKLTVFGGTGAVPDELVKLIAKASV